MNFAKTKSKCLLESKGVFTYKEKTKPEMIKQNNVIEEDDDLDGESIHNDKDNNLVKATNTLFVENISHDISETLLISLFEKHGTIKKIRKMMNYAVIEFDKIENASDAYLKLNGHLLNGKNKIKISYGNS